MDPIKEFKGLANQLDKFNAYRADNIGMFTQGSLCQMAYEQLVEDLESVIPRVNELFGKYEAKLAEMGLQ